MHSFQGRREQVALYFPHIEVPETPWFNQVLLYWDRAASIIPVGHKLSPYMCALEREGLLECLNPGDALNHSVNDFQRGFFELLFTEEFLAHRHLVESNGFLTKYTNVHVDKMSWQLFEELHRRKLAWRDPDRAMWFRVETAAAATYMAYLAGVLSGARPGMSPVTDQLDPLRWSVRPIKPGPQLAELRYAYIQRALPVPSGRIRVEDLIEFKAQFAVELRRCRRFLDSRLATIAAIDDPEDRDEMSEHLLDEIEEDIDELTSQMNQRRWPEVTLKAVCGAGSIAAGTASALIASGSPLGVGLGIGAAISGGVLSVRDALEEWTTQRYDPNAPLAYAALARRTFA